MKSSNMKWPILMIWWWNFNRFYMTITYNMRSDKMRETGNVKIRFYVFLNRTAVACLPEGKPRNTCCRRPISLFLAGRSKRKTLLFPTVFNTYKRAWNHSRQRLWGPVGRTSKHSECCVLPRVFMVATVISYVHEWDLLQNHILWPASEMQKQWFL